MHGLYPNDASLIDSIGRLLIVALFLIIGIMIQILLKTHQYFLQMTVDKALHRVRGGSIAIE